MSFGTPGSDVPFEITENEKEWYMGYTIPRSEHKSGAKEMILVAVYMFRNNSKLMCNSKLIEITINIIDAGSRCEVTLCKPIELIYEQWDV